MMILLTMLAVLAAFFAFILAIDPHRRRDARAVGLLAAGAILFLPDEAHAQGAPNENHPYMSDIDQDGLKNEVDMCPTIPGDIEHGGCPTVVVYAKRLHEAGVDIVDFCNGTGMGRTICNWWDEALSATNQFIERQVAMKLERDLARAQAERKAVEAITEAITEATQRRLALAVPPQCPSGYHPQTITDNSLLESAPGGTLPLYTGMCLNTCKHAIMTGTTILTWTGAGLAAASVARGSFTIANITVGGGYVMEFGCSGRYFLEP